MIGIFAVIIVLALLIFFHELGHFLVAKMFKMGVSIFSLGFGPKLIGIKKGNTDYRISAIPLGGYVKLVGEKPDEPIEPPFTKQESFALRPAWQRILVVLAGPLFNFVLAWFIFWGLFFTQGKLQILPSIGKVIQNSPAETAGLKPGDLILKVNNTPISTWEELVKIVKENQEKPLSLTIQRGKYVYSLTVTPEIKTVRNIFGETIKTPQIGIVAGNNFKTYKLNFFSSSIEGLVHTFNLTKLTVIGIVKLIERILPLETIGGPITIAKLVSDQAQYGIINLLNLVALLSINLGLLNLLPIPVLDGGHILFYGLEIILRRPLSEKVQQISIKIGLTILFSLMGLAIYNDIMRIIK
ncbi:RIP metalloprotease RseP [Desulfonauticus submarinus]